jgi:hypothetical protein
MQHVNYRKRNIGLVVVLLYATPCHAREWHGDGRRYVRVSALVRWALTPGEQAFGPQLPETVDWFLARNTESAEEFPLVALRFG